jgi:hypothetical protein
MFNNFFRKSRRLWDNVETWVISGFRRAVVENCALLGCYAATDGNILPMFQDNLSEDR